MSTKQRRCLEGFGEHVGKGYIYFAMAFALGIELINMKLRAKTKVAPVTLHHRFEDEEAHTKQGLDEKAR